MRVAVPFTLDRHITMPAPVDPGSSTLDELRRVRAAVAGHRERACRTPGAWPRAGSTSWARRSNGDANPAAPTSSPGCRTRCRPIWRPSERTGGARSPSVTGLEPPRWADEIVAEFDEVISLGRIGDVEGLETEELLRADADMRGARARALPGPRGAAPADRRHLGRTGAAVPRRGVGRRPVQGFREIVRVASATWRPGTTIHLVVARRRRPQVAIHDRRTADEGPRMKAAG